MVLTSGVVELSWAEKVRRAEQHAVQHAANKEIPIDLATHEPEIDAWLVTNKERVASMLKPIVVNLFEAERKSKE